MYKPFISENIKTIWISYLLSNIAYTKYMLSYIYSCSKNNNNGKQFYQTKLVPFDRSMDECKTGLPHIGQSIT